MSNVITSRAPPFKHLILVEAGLLHCEHLMLVTSVVQVRMIMAPLLMYVVVRSHKKNVSKAKPAMGDMK